ncbi:Cytochrome P450 11B, mitochondrial [Bagarius yarrelli]|uniref:steroid 11beta-monooxygenase n=1 Tax=Bagarius yarrelli TaxID=175774 RepID=A0A556TUP8_BAGYA|nr:Cytochrome P450 11B, mitochondrial [Bagarius yarrelli]
MSLEGVSSLQMTSSAVGSYAVPVEHLDYSFIQQCGDLKYLDKILQTAVPLQFALFELARNPAVQERVRAQVQSSWLQAEGNPYKALQGAPLLKGTVKETLRLYPVGITVQRYPVRDIVLQNYHIPAENVESFSGAGFHSLAFGFGARQCVGRRIAENEMQLLLLHVSDEWVETRVESGGILCSRKGVNLPGVELVNLPAVGEQDRADLQVGVDEGVDIIFASFVRCAEDVREIRRTLGPRGAQIKIISKAAEANGVAEVSAIGAKTESVASVSAAVIEPTVQESSATERPSVNTDSVPSDEVSEAGTPELTKHKGRKELCRK